MHTRIFADIVAIFTINLINRGKMTPVKKTMEIDQEKLNNIKAALRDR